MRAARLAAAFAVCLAGACAPPDGVLVFSASSLAEVFAELAPEARVNPAGSSTLAAQIREGAHADVYAAAGPEPALALHAAGEIEEPVPFARNRLVLIVPAANSRRISHLGDVQRPGVRLIVGAPGVPIGDHTRRYLTTTGAASVLRNAVSEEESVAGIVGKVALGEADAGFVYATDVARVRGRVKVVPLPRSAEAEITAVIAVVRDAPHPVAARALVRRVLGPEGRRALTSAGFVLP